jgi:hypothetical protein
MFLGASPTGQLATQASSAEFLRGTVGSGQMETSQASPVASTYQPKLQVKHLFEPATFSQVAQLVMIESQV